jgi:hypothetical protein
MRHARRDRGALVTRTLLVLGVALLALVVVLISLRGRSGPPRNAAPTATTTAPTTTAPPPATTAPATTAPPPATTAPPPATTTAPQPPAPIRVTALTPFSVTVEWHTEQPTAGRLALARGDGAPTLWSEPVGPARDHSATIGGLALDSDYRAEAAGLSLSLHTPRFDSSLVASRDGDVVMLDGEPFFPLMVWGECPAAYGPAVAAGVDLFAQNPCGGVDAQVSALDGHALSAGIAGDADWQNPAVIGWFYPDEADARGLTARTLPALPPSQEVGRLSFLTLSNHAFSRASPPPLGRGVYRGLIRKADVVGLDLYPLQEWCTDDVDLVFQAQRDLVSLAGGRPTFQWIEAGPMRCRGRRGVTVTPAVVRAESLLAVAGGAHGLGFFPGEWSSPIAAAIERLTGELKAISPALLAPAIPVGARGPVRAGAHELNGALYVVAVNPTRRGVATRLSVPGARGRSFDVLGESRVVTARGGRLVDRLPPLAARIYLAAPP